MTYNEAFNRSNILNNIPLSYEGRKLPKSTAASVMLLRVAYSQKVDEFVGCMEEVRKGLKKEGFDARAAAVERMRAAEEKLRKYESGEGGEKPSEKELEEAAKTRSTLDAFEQEKKELEESMAEANRKKAEESVEVKGSLSPGDLADIYEMLGVEGDIEVAVPGNKIVKMDKSVFLQLVATIVN